MTFQRADGAAPDRARSGALRPVGPRRRRRLRSEPRAGRLRAPRRRLHRPRRRRDHVPRAAARARARRRLRRRSPGSAIATAAGFRHTPDRPVSCARRGRHRAAEPRRPRPRRLHAARPAGRRRRDLARLHLRLQLLLDHRDARPQLPHLRLRPRPRRHPRLRATAAPGRSSSSTTTSRSTCSASRALCQAIVDAGLHDLDYVGPGDDGVDRRPWRDAGAADAPGRLPLRLPRHRERARGRSRVPQGVGEEHASARRAAARRQRDAHRHRAPAPPRHVRRRRADRRQPRRHARGDRGQPRLRAALRRLALHPASDAVPGDADDAGPPRARPRSSTTASRSTTARRRWCAARPCRPRRSSSCAGGPSAG